MKRSIFVLFFTMLILSACGTTDKGQLLMSGKKIMCLSEERKTCIEEAKSKCISNGYEIIREEYEDNTWPFEDNRYILTFICR
tara:strand:+ start:80 stop:328 length:249 start_codon:yes stop_codon:yes gene_type:complete